MIIECKTCEALVDAELLCYYLYEYEDGDAPDRYSFLKCPQCANPILVAAIDDYLEDPYRLYPPEDAPLSFTIPEPIRNSYKEALSCFNRAKAYTATAILCRKTLEGMCSEYGFDKGNLPTRLQKLRDKGVIESRLYEWADMLRLFGNDAAHDVNVTISKKDAEDILEFTHAILEYVFTFQDKFEKFKQRRSAEKKS